MVGDAACMTTPENIEDAIDQNARNPKRVTVGNTTVEQHSIKDQIAADNHAAAKKSATNSVKGFGLRFNKIVPPGAG